MLTMTGENHDALTILGLPSRRSGAFEVGGNDSGRVLSGQLDYR
jgi:hypothetical protein